MPNAAISAHAKDRIKARHERDASWKGFLLRAAKVGVSFAAVWFLPRLLPDQQVPLRQPAAAVLFMFWLFFSGPLFADGLSIWPIGLRWSAVQRLDDMRDIVEDRTGKRYSRSDLSDAVINAIYDYRSFAPDSSGQFIFIPDSIGDRVNRIAGVLRASRAWSEEYYWPDLIRTVSEAVCDSEILIRHIKPPDDVRKLIADALAKV